jgi:threonine dehydrogenase-like Zn-dependent dehydrogenase
VSLDPLALFVKEATLTWSNCYDHPHVGADFETAIRLIDAHRDALGAVITHQLALGEIQRGFALAADRSAGAAKVTILI